MKIKIIIGEKEEFIEISENKSLKDLLDIIDIASETVFIKKNDFIVIDEELLKKEI